MLTLAFSPEYTLTLATIQPLAASSFSPASSSGSGADGGLVTTGGVATGGGGNLADGIVGGDTEVPAEDGGEVASENGNGNQLAAAFLGLPDNILKFFSSFDCVVLLIALVLLALIIAWFADRKREWFELPNLDRRFRQLIVAEAVFLFALYIALIFGKECLYTPISVISGILFILLLVTFLQKRRGGQ